MSTPEQKIAEQIARGLRDSAWPIHSPMLGGECPVCGVGQLRIWDSGMVQVCGECNYQVGTVGPS